MELMSEQLLTEVMKNGRDRRFGEDVGDLTVRADVVHFCSLGSNLLT